MYVMFVSLNYFNGIKAFKPKVLPLSRTIGSHHRMIERNASLARWFVIKRKQVLSYNTERSSSVVGTERYGYLWQGSTAQLFYAAQQLMVICIGQAELVSLGSLFLTVHCNLYSMVVITYNSLGYCQ